MQTLKPYPDAHHEGMKNTKKSKTRVPLNSVFLRGFVVKLRL